MLRSGLLILSAGMLPAAGALACYATLAHAQTPAPPPKFEAWTGAEAFGSVWSLYAGGSYAPFGGISEDGLRLRAVAGYSQYSYSSTRWTGASVRAFDFHGSTSFADLLAGYHKTFGPLTIKLLGGVTLTDELSDDRESIGGTEIGGKAVVETWWNVTDQVWTSIDLSWTTLDDLYSARGRLGWRTLPQLSLGVEGAATGSWQYQATRIGGFARYEWTGGEASISAGLAEDGSRSSVGLPGAYITLNVLTRF